MTRVNLTKSQVPCCPVGFLLVYWFPERSRVVENILLFYRKLFFFQHLQKIAFIFVPKTIGFHQSIKILKQFKWIAGHQSCLDCCQLDLRAERSLDLRAERSLDLRAKRSSGWPQHFLKKIGQKLIQKIH